MLRNLVSYLRSPEEGMPFNFKPLSILSSFWLYLVAVMGLTILAAVVAYCLGEAFPSMMRPKIVGHTDSPAWIVALLGSILEEGAFRLSLKRKKITVAASLLLISFILISVFCYSGKIYSLDHLLVRIFLAVAAGGCLYILLGKLMLNCRFKPYFWFWGVFFGCVHLMNVHFAGFLILDYVSLLSYTATRIIMGLVLGYIRMKNGFVVSTSLHILNNLITVI